MLRLGACSATWPVTVAGVLLAPAGAFVSAAEVVTSETVASAARDGWVAVPLRTSAPFGDVSAIGARSAGACGSAAAGGAAGTARVAEVSVGAATGALRGGRNVSGST